MPRAFSPNTKHPFSYVHLRRPLTRILSGAPPLTSRGNKPLELDFEQQLNALILFHLEEHSSAQELLQFLDEDDVARLIVGAPGGIKKSTFLLPRVYAYTRGPSITRRSTPGDFRR